jgi:hypothetical protein
MAQFSAGTSAGQSLPQLGKATAPAKAVTVAERTASRIMHCALILASSPVPTVGAGVRTRLGSRTVRRADAEVFVGTADAIPALDADLRVRR